MAGMVSWLLSVYAVVFFVQRRRIVEYFQRARGKCQIYPLIPG